MSSGNGRHSFLLGRCCWRAALASSPSPPWTVVPRALARPTTNLAKTQAHGGSVVVVVVVVEIAVVAVVVLAAADAVAAAIAVATGLVFN